MGYAGLTSVRFPPSVASCNARVIGKYGSLGAIMVSADCGSFCRLIEVFNNYRVFPGSCIGATGVPPTFGFISVG